MGTRSSSHRTLFVIAVLVVVLLSSQALALRTSPPRDVSTAGRAVGRAGFAYLGGLRTFAAAVLWNRLDPVSHEYYGGVTLDEERFMLPTLYLVTVLDPQFTQAYYLSSFMVSQMVGAEEGIDLAREGVANNPDSGLMRVNLAQLLFVQDRAINKTEIIEQIEAGLDPEQEWANDEERFEGYLLMARMLEPLGYEDRAHSIEEVLGRMAGAGIGLGDHDHDGDGKQDH